MRKFKGKFIQNELYIKKALWGSDVLEERRPPDTEAPKINFASNMSQWLILWNPVYVRT